MLKGKNAIITGGSRGIGRAIALKLAEQGANIAVIYHGSKEAAEETCTEARAFGVEAYSYKCNIADFKEVKETLDEAIKEMKKIDILVNNAGITKDGLIYSMKEEDFDRVVDTNLKGTFNTIKHLTGHFIKNRAGKIVNISSIAGIIGNPGQANYSASKAGIIGLTKAVAKELGSRGICCNAIAPGFIETEMTKEFLKREELIKAIPLGYMGKTEDVAELVLFLASDKSNYITGEVIRIDGGLAI